MTSEPNKRTRSDANKSHAVGYAKPPRHTRFKKGQSGNPNGRPQGSPNLATAIERVLLEQVVVNEDGEPKIVNKLEAMVKQMVNNAVSGDARARQQVMGVLHVMEGGAEAPVTPGPVLGQDDQQVMQQILARMWRALKEGGNDEPDAG